jgi:hypothetical protein
MRHIPLFRCSRLRDLDIEGTNLSVVIRLSALHSNVTPSITMDQLVFLYSRHPVQRQH